MKTSINVRRVTIIIIMIIIIIILQMTGINSESNVDHKTRHHSGHRKEEYGNELDSVSNPSLVSGQKRANSPDWSLPLNTEIKEFILSGEVKRLNFYVEKTDNPLTLTVTPCSEPIDWSFYYLEDKRFSGPKFDKLRRSRRGRRKRRHKRLKLRGKPQLITRHFGSGRVTYSDEIRHFPGIYILELNSRGHDAILSVFLSQFYPYPLLPHEASEVRVNQLDSESIEVSWTPSPTEAIIPVHYLITVSQAQNVISFCQIEKTGLTSHNGGDGSKDQLDTGQDNQRQETNNSNLDLSLSPFTNWWENMVKNLMAESRKLNSQMKLRVERSTNNSWHLITRLLPNITYFIDVIAVNQMSNLTSIYSGIRVTTPIKYVNLPLKLKDQQMKTFELLKENNYTKVAKYSFPLNQLDILDSSVWFWVQSCSGSGPVKVHFKEGNRLLQTEEVYDFKTIQVKINNVSRSNWKSPRKFANASSTVKYTKGQLRSNLTSTGLKKLSVFISSDTQEKRTGTILVNRKYGRYPFPRLPFDRSIKAFDSQTTFDSVTLSWNASPDEKVRYCIFNKQITDESVDHEIDLFGYIRPQNTCEDIRESFSSSNGKLINYRKILCRRYHKYSKRRFRDTIIQKIKYLKYGTNYIFTVQVTKNRGKSLYYEPILISTKSKSEAKSLRSIA